MKTMKQKKIESEGYQTNIVFSNDSFNKSNNIVSNQKIKTDNNLKNENAINDPKNYLIDDKTSPHNHKIISQKSVIIKFKDGNIMNKKKTSKQINEHNIMLNTQSKKPILRKINNLHKPTLSLAEIFLKDLNKTDTKKTNIKHEKTKPRIHNPLCISTSVVIKKSLISKSPKDNMISNSKLIKKTIISKGNQIVGDNKSNKLIKGELKTKNLIKEEKQTIIKHLKIDVRKLENEIKTLEDLNSHQQLYTINKVRRVDLTTLQNDNDMINKNNTDSVDTCLNSNLIFRNLKKTIFKTIKYLFIK